MSTGFREGISKFFGKSNLAKGVRIKMEGKTVNVFVYVIVAYGVNIPEVALKIQKNVKEAVENYDRVRGQLRGCPCGRRGTAQENQSWNKAWKKPEGQDAVPVPKNFKC
jgi:hypothetical protein